MHFGTADYQTIRRPYMALDICLTRFICIIPRINEMLTDRGDYKLNEYISC